MNIGKPSFRFIVSNRTIMRQFELLDRLNSLLDGNVIYLLQVLAINCVFFIFLE